MGRKLKISAAILSGLRVLGNIVVELDDLWGTLSGVKYRSIGTWKYSQQQLTAGVRRLEKKGLVRSTKAGNSQTLRLTNLGLTELKKIELEKMEIRKPKKWDGKFWLVLFDIPEKYRLRRNVLVAYLKRLGFWQIQKSVWMHLYRCEEEIRLLGKMYQIEPYIKIALVEKINLSDRQKRFFNLKK